MSEAQKVIYSLEDKNYDVNKFTGEGKLAVVRFHKLNNKINILSDDLEDLKAASIIYKATIDNQLTDEMLADEEAAEETE